MRIARLSTIPITFALPISLPSIRFMRSLKLTIPIHYPTTNRKRPMCPWWLATFGCKRSAAESTRVSLLLTLSALLLLLLHIRRLWMVSTWRKLTQLLQSHLRRILPRVVHVLTIVPKACLDVSSLNLYGGAPGCPTSCDVVRMVHWNPTQGHDTSSVRDDLPGWSSHSVVAAKVCQKSLSVAFNAR